ncbi:MAG: glucose-6-phosphate isomerase, partial [Gammaproteobacteria bacterium]|nr:glucose-6-phosphate isomerase [Gammaproteobacteria bacterium]
MAYYQHPLDVTRLPTWQALQAHRDSLQHFSMREAFAADNTRFDSLSLSSCGLFLDYSKNLITTQTREMLVSLAREA